VCVHVCLKSPHVLVECVVQLCQVVITTVTIHGCKILLDLGNCTDSPRTSPTDVEEVFDGGVRTNRVSCVSGELEDRRVAQCG
jgi:hypothetical protein